MGTKALVADTYAHYAPELWLQIRAAEIYEWEGEFEEAIFFYRSDQEKNPDNEAAIDGLRRMDGSLK